METRTDGLGDEASTSAGVAGPGERVGARRSVQRRRALIAVGAGVALIALAGGVFFADSRRGLADDFSGSDGLITNEWAYHHPRDPRAVRSADWDVTSGSLFRSQGQGWSGDPDTVAPDPTSRNGNNSAVFRMVSRERFGDGRVDFKLRIDAYTGRGDGGHGWDGVHVFLRYQDEYSLYAVSVARRDGTVAIKKKVPGGDANGGTYYTLSDAPAPLQPGSWHEISTVVGDEAGAARISLWIDGRLVLQALDDGMGGPPFLGEGRVGLRSDDVEFHVDDLLVHPT